MARARPLCYATASGDAQDNRDKSHQIDNRQLTGVRRESRFQFGLSPLNDPAAALGGGL